MKNDDNENGKKEDPLLLLVKSIDLASVQLIGSDFAVHIPPEVITPERVGISFNYEFKWAVNLVEDPPMQEIFCFISTLLVGKFKEELPEYKQIPGGQVLNGRFTYAVRYIAKGNQKPSEDLLEKLTRIQANFHAYPYIRSYVDWQLAQMGIYGVVLPLLKQAMTHDYDPKK
jgi:hypothetical protein